MNKYYAISVWQFAKQFKSPVTINKESNMKMFTVTIITSDMNNGRKYSNRVDVIARHESEARSLAFTNLDDLLMECNILSVDIIENLDRVSALIARPI